MRATPSLFNWSDMYFHSSNGSTRSKIFVQRDLLLTVGCLALEKICWKIGFFGLQACTENEVRLAHRGKYLCLWLQTDDSSVLWYGIVTPPSHRDIPKTHGDQQYLPLTLLRSRFEVTITLFHTGKRSIRYYGNGSPYALGSRYQRKIWFL